jgi:hypothetical protein
MNDSVKMGHVLRDSLFPEGDFRFQMRFQRGQIPEFFDVPAERAVVLAERRRWLAEAPRRYSGLLPGGEALFMEMCELLSVTHSSSSGPGEDGMDAEERLRQLGGRMDVDFLLLAQDSAQRLRLLGGCVCFPSSWSLAEKLGEPVETIHEVVPGLNGQLGVPIATFLRRLGPGITWLRANWGLSRSAELNQHPERQLPRLGAGVTLPEVFLRVEDQALVKLPRTDGVLFGIRVTVYPLAAVVADRETAGRFRRALETMPEAMALYKGLAAARADLLRALAR